MPLGFNYLRNSMTKKLAPFFAVLFTATLLTGCSVLSPSDAGNSSQESPAAPEHGPSNPSLDEALADWKPLSEFAPKPYKKRTGDFSAADMKLMSEHLTLPWRIV